MATLKQAVQSQGQGGAATARPVSPADLDDIIPPAGPIPMNRPPVATSSYSKTRRIYNGSGGIRNNRIIRVLGALFGLGFAVFVWFMSESTTLAVPRFFTRAVDASPWNVLAWFILLGMTALIVGHIPDFHQSEWFDSIWVLFTAIDVLTTFAALADYVRTRAIAQHIDVVFGSLGWIVMLGLCFILAVLCVFLPVVIARAAIWRIRDGMGI